MTEPVDVRQYVMTPADVSNDVIELLRAAKSDDWRVVDTGLVELDEVVTLYPGSLTGILGRPSMGKSLWAKALARRELERIARSGRKDECVVYVTLEEAPAVIGMALDGSEGVKLAETLPDGNYCAITGSPTGLVAASVAGCSSASTERRARPSAAVDPDCAPGWLAGIGASRASGSGASEPC